LLRHWQSACDAAIERGDTVSFAQDSAPETAPVTTGSLPTRTLGRTTFDAACAELTIMVGRDYAPALLVGVRTGGFVVAETMARMTSLPVLPLTCRRPTTALKSLVPGLKPLLSALPEPLLNALRRAEHRAIAGHRRAGQAIQIDLAEAAAIADRLRTSGCGARVLVVDDAVDSGVTLATVLQTLRAICPPATALRTAVITVTTEDPVVAPDYALYRGVLCRFPWSFDARG
jgi:hypoxanthine phosphoribosyltransferase